MALPDSQNIDADKQVLAYHKAKVKEKDLQIASLQQQITALQNENRTILKSISFRLGAFLISPLRRIQDFFSPQIPQENSAILGSCDTAFSAAGYLEVSGWALSDNAIEKIEIYSENELLGQAELGIYREDVHHSFQDHPFSKNSGYYYRIKKNIQHEMVTVKIFDQKHSIELQKVIIPSIQDMTINAQYQIFLQQNTPTKNTVAQLIQQMNALSYQPLISVIVPVYNVEAQWLNLCIESVLNQWYQNWQMCLYDDCSTSIATRECLKKWHNHDPRIEIKLGKRNHGISLASNAAIDMAKGDFIGLLDHDDELTPDALFHVVSSLNHDKTLDFIYSDEDKIDESGQLCDPHFKSDFNLATLLCHNYICHFSVIRKSVGDAIGWFRQGYEGSQDHDLFLRVCQNTHLIHHIPQVLYHWRKIAGSTSVDISNKSYAQNAARKAIKDYLCAQNFDATVEDGIFTNSYRVRLALNNQPLVSIIIPFRDELSLLRTCIDSIINTTDYAHYEVLLIDNQSQDPEMAVYLQQLSMHNSNFHVHYFDEPFNYAKLNNWAVKKAAGKYVLFLNNDMQVINKGWLTAMLEQTQFKKVAAVGAKLLFPDDTIQHAGVVVSDKTAVHINKFLADEATGYCERANYIQNISACTAACLLVDKSVFNDIGGFNAIQFSIAYNDIDLCLRIRQAGYLITYTPYAKLYHFESQSRGLDDSGEKLERFTDEILNYQKAWGAIYKNGDPYFNQHFKTDSEKINLNI